MPGPNGRVAGTLGTCERYGGGKGLDRAGPEAAGGVVGDPAGAGGAKNPPGLVRSRLPVLAPVLAAGGSGGRPPPHAARLEVATISTTMEYNVAVSRAGSVRLCWGTSDRFRHAAATRYSESWGL